MPSRRRALETVAATVTIAVGGCIDGGSSEGGDDSADEPNDANDGDSQDSTMNFDTPAFEEGASIPTEYTCDGADVSPPLSIEGVPDGAAALAIVVDDPDAPGGTFTHWTCWNVPAATTEIPEDVSADPEPAEIDGARQGENDFGEVGYRGPCPPEGDDPHEYRFTLAALEDGLDLEAGAAVETVREELESATIGEAGFSAVYGR